MAETNTTAAVTKPTLSEREVAGLAACMGEPQPLTELRQISRQVYDKTPLPDRVRHLWRFSDAAALLPARAPLVLGPRRPSPSPQPPAAGAIALLPPGEPPHVSVSPEAARAGVALVPLTEGGRHLARLGHLVGPEHGLFEALNLAAWSSGLLVHVPRGVRAPGLVRVVVPAAAEGACARLLVVVEEGGELDLVEEHVEGGPASRQTTVSELLIGAGARVAHAQLQLWAPAASGHLTSRAGLERDATYLGVSVGLGGHHTKLDAGARLEGPGARSELVGVVLGDRRQSLDHHTAHEHLAPNTWSDIDFKVAVGGRARSAYTGLIRIAGAGRGSEAYQENRNLLLSGRARAETIPELEILTDDVTCTHGATVAPLDEEQLFYLASRGLPRARALHMATQAFFAASMARLPGSLREVIEPHIEARLGALLGGRA